jgi:hypothetical protein
VEVGRAVEGEGGGGLAALGRLGGQRVGAARRDDLGGMRGGEAFSWRMTLWKVGEHLWTGLHIWRFLLRSNIY